MNVGTHPRLMHALTVLSTLAVFAAWTFLTQVFSDCVRDVDFGGKDMR